MDTNDFIGSFAQENVAFATQVVRTSAVGDNFWKVMVFVENDRFVDATAADWADVPGTTIGARALAVSADDYAKYTSGLLRSWLYDLFCNGFTGDCILVACGTIPVTTSYDVVTPAGNENPKALGWYERTGSGPDYVYTLSDDETVDAEKTYCTRTDTPDATAFIEGMEATYDIMKAYAYHKTACAGTDSAVLPAVAVALANKCKEDKNLLSSCPLFPFTTASPETPSSDPLYSALNSAGVDAFMSAHQDTTRNGALFSLGLALAVLNGSGTSVGNSMDMISSNMITCSGPNGLQLSKGIRDNLANINIQTFKPVGNNSGDVAAYGAKTLLGDVYQANWIIAYVTYMVKVRVAELITSINFLKNEDNYRRIVAVLASYVGKFGPNGSQRLASLNITAPAFGELPEAAGDQIIVPNAWSATYVDQVREVQITGTLYIGV